MRQNSYVYQKWFRSNCAIYIQNLCQNYLRAGFKNKKSWFATNYKGYFNKYCLHYHALRNANLLFLR